MTAAMNCPNCAAPLPAGAGACPACGLFVPRAAGMATGLAPRPRVVRAGPGGGAGGTGTGVAGAPGGTTAGPATPGGPRVRRVGGGPPTTPLRRTGGWLPRRLASPLRPLGTWLRSPIETIEGVVCSNPQLVPARHAHGRALGLLGIVLLALLLLPYVLVAFMPLFIIGALLMMVGGRSGLLLPFALFEGLARQGAGAGGRQQQAMVFRLQAADATVTQVQLDHHAGSVELGDRVCVSGLRNRGVLHALRLRNDTTGTSLVTRHLRALIAAGVVVLLLILAALGGSR
jgi:hypothetical protein